MWVLVCLVNCFENLYCKIRLILSCYLFRFTLCLSFFCRCFLYINMFQIWSPVFLCRQYSRCYCCNLYNFIIYLFIYLFFACNIAYLNLFYFEGAHSPSGFFMSFLAILFQILLYIFLFFMKWQNKRNWTDVCMMHYDV